MGGAAPVQAVPVGAPLAVAGEALLVPSVNISRPRGWGASELVTAGITRAAALTTVNDDCFTRSRLGARRVEASKRTNPPTKRKDGTMTHMVHCNLQAADAADEVTCGSLTGGRQWVWVGLPAEDSLGNLYVRGGHTCVDEGHPEGEDGIALRGFRLDAPVRMKKYVEARFSKTQAVIAEEVACGVANIPWNPDMSKVSETLVKSEQNRQREESKKQLTAEKFKAFFDELHLSEADGRATDKVYCMKLIMYENGRKAGGLQTKDSLRMAKAIAGECAE
jgi:hypothetical protein